MRFSSTSSSARGVSSGTICDSLEPGRSTSRLGTFLMNHAPSRKYASVYTTVVCTTGNPLLRARSRRRRMFLISASMLMAMGDTAGSEHPWLQSMIRRAALPESGASAESDAGVVLLRVLEIHAVLLGNVRVRAGSRPHHSTWRRSREGKGVAGRPGEGGDVARAGPAWYAARSRYAGANRTK